MTRATLIAGFSAVALAACGMGTSAPDVAAYQQDVTELLAAVTTHQADSAATVGAEDCLAEHQRYDGAMRPRLQQLNGMSGSMDSCLRMMGRAGPYDMQSMCGSMQAELDRHATAACAGDAAANHAEAAHHCQVMQDWLSQQQARAASMMTMRGGRCSP